MNRALVSSVLLRVACSQYVSYWQAMQHYGETSNAKDEAGSQGANLETGSQGDNLVVTPSHKNYWQTMQQKSYGKANAAKDETEDQATSLTEQAPSRSSAQKPVVSDSHPYMNYWQTMQHDAEVNDNAAPANQAFLSATQRKATYDPIQLTFAVLFCAAFALLVLVFKRRAPKNVLGEGLLG
eukprot:gnl/MRDRNA2_/MRDRNA2_79167_c0_seq1.p1 gnl/MRDRNA2_/MRDRNA2_79167_c0~~gnl/MRDRNA2_/MRDRNA2_79167_c0_seq1.p1  ORF type:complete len:182 (-),score=37.34 gnl/MRDRNA2_/MRDRNA2_79167_c0_seq1:332-877(-)